MTRSQISKILFISGILLLFSNALAISRDSQDSWILQGIEITFVLFVATYAFAFFSEKRTPWMVVLAIIGRFIFLMIPNLKYVWFQGTYIDQQMQYGLAQYVVNQGHLASQIPSSFVFYSSTPFIHLEFAVFSMVLNVPVMEAFKYLPVLLSPIYPLLTYCILKNLKLSEEKNVLKYALFLSSIPFSYFVSGSLFGVLLYFLILHSLLVSLDKNDRRYIFLFLFFGSVLVATHSVSSVLLVVFLLPIIILQRFPRFRLKKPLKLQTVFVLVSINAAWLVFQAKATFESLLEILFFAMPRGVGPPGTVIPTRFFELSQINIVEAMKTLLVLNGSDAFLLLLTLAGLLILLKTRQKNNNRLTFLSIFTGSLFVFLVLGLASVGGFRVLNYVQPLFPIFSSLFILQISRRKNWMPVVLFSLILVLATVQYYQCQPLIPASSVLSENLPSDEPLLYITSINSIYQRRVITFASEYVTGMVACDWTTTHQIKGLTEQTFWVSHVVWWRGGYPLADEPSTEYDFFLIHTPGISGPFQEQAEMRTEDLILEAIYNSSIVYTNGESYALIYTFKETG